MAEAQAGEARSVRMTIGEAVTFGAEKDAPFVPVTAGKPQGKGEIAKEVERRVREL